MYSAPQIRKAIKYYDQEGQSITKATRKLGSPDRKTLANGLTTPAKIIRVPLTHYLNDILG